MADPVTLTALAVAGTGVSAISAVSQGLAASAAGDFNAELAERDQKIAQEQGKFDREQIRRQLRSTLGTQRAAAAASGGGLEGSPLLIMAETAAEAELDILANRFSQNIAEGNAQSNASLSRFQGRQGLTGGVLSAGSSLLTGASRAGELLGEDEP